MSFFKVGVSLAIVLLGSLGVFRALHSPLFVVRVVEVEDSSGDFFKNVPVTPQDIQALSQVKVGVQNLYEVDLTDVENRVLLSPWVKSARIRKRFPHTLSIQVRFRDPRAIYQAKKDGRLSYIDSDGELFGEVDLSVDSNLPFVGGARVFQKTEYQSLLALVDQWKGTLAGEYSQLSSLTWDPNSGLRALVIYPMIRDRDVGRAIIELGQEIDPKIQTEKFDQLGKVIRYLSGKSISAQRIWMSASKKIVVKTLRGS